MAGPLLFLGPQRPDPNAPLALGKLLGESVLHEPPDEGAPHPVVVIAAGWRQDESEEKVLRKHLGPHVSVLPLYGWFDVVMRERGALAAAYRARQSALIRLKELHRVRLEAALSAVHQLWDHDHDAPGSRTLRQALAAVRQVDADLLGASEEVHAEHGRPWDDDPMVARLQARAAEVLGRARAVVLPGGHVAVLRNRMTFFDVVAPLRARHAAGTPVVAWSAGSMVLTDRIVLFYDDPPDGPSYPEILDQGFGFVSDLVALPHARQRLRLDEPRRVALLASRFAPSACLALENGAWLVERDGVWFNRGPAGTAQRLQADGAVVPLPSWEGA